MEEAIAGRMTANKGMEYCAVRGIFHQLLDWTKQRFDIHQDVARRFTIAAIHEIHVGARRGEELSPYYEVLDLRAQVLIPYIVQGLEGVESPSATDIKCALESSFQRVEKEVQARAQELNLKCDQVVLETRLNSLVVVVHDGSVYVAGAADAEIFLARDSKPFYLTSFSHHLSRRGIWMHPHVDTIRRSTEPVLFYFCQERLQATDAYLVMASCNFTEYVENIDFILPVLQSRIDVEGLNEACKSMVGPYRDGNKILLVVTLQLGAHLPKSSTQPVAEELLDTRRYHPRKKVMVEDPPCFLLPYVNGKKQYPVPLTSAVYTLYHSIPQPCSLDEIEIVSSYTGTTKKRKRVSNEAEAEK